MPAVVSLDHLVLTVTDLEATIAFYRDGLGMTADTFTPADGSQRWALSFGNQKINLHPAEAPFAPHAEEPKPGSSDLCFLSDAPLSDWQTHLSEQHIPIVLGPIERTGVMGPILSLYVRDPDGNLIEISQRV
ncbi:MAG: VOC family protein [Pseudomonadota bacterium]